MAIAEREIKKPKVLTYEDYLMEGETPGRYEIIDGVRTWMTGASYEHNIVVFRISTQFSMYEAVYGDAKLVPSPQDIITRREPLRSRQPDVSLISMARWEGRVDRDSSPLAKPPELVVEVLSPSETKRMIAAKMREYSGIGVHECWLARPIETTVEVWALSLNAEPKLVATYSPGSTIQSISFVNLSIDISKIFGL